MATIMYGPYRIPDEYWTPKRLRQEVFRDKETTIHWCKDHGLLSNTQICKACGISMLWVAHKRGIDGYKYATLFRVELN